MKSLTAFMDRFTAEWNEAWEKYSAWGYRELLAEATEWELKTGSDTRATSAWGDSELIEHILEMQGVPRFNKGA